MTNDFSGLNDLDEDEEHHIDEFDDMERHSPLTISPISKDCCEIIGKSLLSAKTAVKSLVSVDTHRYYELTMVTTMGIDKAAKFLTTVK